ncbi:30S ribosomal protein S4 [Candidatus Aerophobetes bacterium]|uniref:Small ribosomal subunit protein uS4 n=2 Tax=Aerophobetes bacterium TaxID=2030807 RepID=A0A2A4YBI1_UNCAE|nr:MAG: 30S ribosomal protein S4 [Candidatus Aerophobetes bacterium]
MSRYTGPKNRVARRFGVNIFGRRRNPLLHKPNPPGMHGSKRKKRSDYGTQLEEKQKLRAVYGMLSQRKLVNYYKKAVKSAGNTAHVFAELLECRLDNIVYRLGFAATIFHAQQLICHGHIQVNGKKVDRRSFQVKPGMEISVREKAKSNALIKENLEMCTDRPEYVSCDPKQMKGQLEVVPAFDQIPYPLPINLPLVCEFLAHTC